MQKKHSRKMGAIALLVALIAAAVGVLLWMLTGAQGYRAAETKKHRQWAHDATLAWRGRDHRPIDGQIDVLITVYPKNRGPVPDGDNAMASCKAFLDGIADALGLNDRNFVPRVQFGERTQHGKIVISLS